jgi:saccharopine dehydrogenase-like NADP-dependent oxidoreductase
MKKVLIIGYGDIGSRIAARLTEQEFIGVSRSASAPLPNVEFIQHDWMRESKLTLTFYGFFYHCDDFKTKRARPRWL